MNPQRALRLLTIAFLILGAASLSSGFFTDDLLPSPLREWQESSSAEISVPVLVILGVLAVGCLLAVLVGSVALLQMKKWGAHLHFSATMIAFLMLPLLGPMIQHPIAYALDSLSMLVTGALYGVAFFTDALATKKVNQTAQT